MKGKRSRTMRMVSVTFLLVVTVGGFVLIGFGPFCLAKSSFTEVSGILNGINTWRKTNSPYNLSGSVIINQGATLRIDPGTTLNFNGYQIIVNGTLVIQGTTAEKIFLNGGTLSDETRFYGGQISFKMYSAGGLIENAISNLTSIYIENTFAKITQSTIIGSLGVSGPKSSPEISNNTIIGQIALSGSTSTITNNSVKGTIFASGPCLIANNTITGNREDEGIHTEGDIPRISDNVITGFKIGVRAYYSANIENNLIINNSRYGIDIGMGYTTIQNNTITQNAVGINSPKPVNTITYNNIYNNTQYNIRLDSYSLYTPSATNNWWGTTNITAINQTMNIYWNNLTAVKVYFTPILLEPNTETPPMEYNPAPAPMVTPNPTPDNFSSYSIPFTLHHANR